MGDIRSTSRLLEDYQRHTTHLEELRALLHERLGAARDAMTENETEPGSEPASPEDPGEPVSLSARRAARAARTVVEIEAAIERLDFGVYGTCEHCGAFIALRRLRQVPHTRHCDDCETPRARPSGPALASFPTLRKDQNTMISDVHLSSVQLDSIREELEGQLLRWTRQLSELEAAVGDDSVEVSEKSALLADIVSAERSASVLRATLGEIAELTYGRCDGCGSGIPFERLKARPLARFCMQCQRRHENG
ncbi:TraR/DksA C4-type zinc finger protein [Streptosporangium sp. NPDC000239]|uniref:TraR/DksA family transcriptional regulator n=1 Tax=unclassified Streptosporangium TaxID=2632669 RepID=UPI0033330943